MHPHTITDADFCTFLWLKSGCFFLTSRCIRHQFFSKTSRYVGSSDSGFHCLSVHLSWAQAQKTGQRFCTRLTYGFFFAQYRFWEHFLMQGQNVLSDNDFPKYSQAHVTISVTVTWGILMQYHLTAQRSCTFSSGFHPWTLHTEVFAIFHPDTRFLKWQINLSWSSAQSGEPWTIFTCKDYTFGERSFYAQSWSPHVLPINLLIEMIPECY